MDNAIQSADSKNQINGNGEEGAGLKNHNGQWKTNESGVMDFPLADPIENWISQSDEQWQMAHALQ